MDDYIIFTDSGCDIPNETLSAQGIWFRDLTFSFQEEDRTYQNHEMSSEQFYQRMRDGQIAKTAAVNADSFVKGFREALQQGYDILYIGLSSAISSTYQSALIAMQDLRKEFPSRQMVAIDSLCACCGLGLLVYLVQQKKNAGASLMEAATYTENSKGRICHWFTVDDLVYLKRGGRVKPTEAVMAHILNIKPLMHVNESGALGAVSKVRGRINTIKAMAAKYESSASGGNLPVFIGHSDCYRDALLLADLIRCRHHGISVHIYPIGPVIGAHSGPGTLALFFVGEER